jgi:hypothetical protein
MLVPVLCRGATVTLRHHSSLAGVRPAKRLCHDSLSGSSPEDGSGSCAGLTPRLSTLLTLAGPVWTGDPGRQPEEKRIRSGSKRVRPPGPDAAAQSSSGEDGSSRPGETRGTRGTMPAGSPVCSMNRAADSRSTSSVGFWKRAAEG